jgi:hypothetical protein
MSVLNLDPFILFHANLFFIHLPFNIHSSFSFTNQLHPILFVHLFFITHSAKPHPLICHCYPSHVYNATIHHSTILHLSLHAYLSNLNLFLKIHPLHSQAHQTTILIIKADLGGHDHQSFSIKSKNWNRHTTTVLKTVFFNFKSLPTKPPVFLVFTSSLKFSLMTSSLRFLKSQVLYQFFDSGFFFSKNPQPAVVRF